MAEERIPTRVEEGTRRSRSSPDTTRYFPGFMEISAALQTKLILEADRRCAIDRVVLALFLALRANIDGINFGHSIVTRSIKKREGKERQYYASTL